MRKEFNNTKPEKPYFTYLYKKVDGVVQSEKFNEADAENAIDNEGWVFSPSAFVDDALPNESDQTKEALKTAADTFASDVDLLLNCDHVEDFEALKAAYEALTDKKLNGMIKTLPSIRKAIKKVI